MRVPELPEKNRGLPRKIPVHTEKASDIREKVLNPIEIVPVIKGKVSEKPEKALEHTVKSRSRMESPVPMEKVPDTKEKVRDVREKAPTIDEFCILDLKSNHSGNLDLIRDAGVVCILYQYLVNRMVQKILEK